MKISFEIITGAKDKPSSPPQYITWVKDGCQIPMCQTLTFERQMKKVSRT